MDIKLSYFAKLVFWVVFLLVSGTQAVTRPSEPGNAQEGSGKEHIGANKSKRELFCPADNPSNGLQTASQNPDLNVIDEKGCTALMRASENGEVRSVQMFLENGANPEVSLSGGVTALI